jgi:hypothetical protein
MTVSQAPRHLLRLEGVNLAAVLYDTPNISVRRGAGLMLRQAVRDIATRLPGLRPISLGASVGLFEFQDPDPAALVARCADELSNDPDYRWLSFVVDSTPLGDDFGRAHQQVIAANRLRQFQQPTLAPVTEAGDACCTQDRLRPVGRHRVKQEPVSDSVHARFEFGRRHRQDFYNDELGESFDLDFSDDLSELAGRARGQSFANLDDKIAVIHLDGNRFGKLQRACDSADELKRFDTTIQTCRRAFLRDLLDAARNDPSFFNGRKLRLETLLWGGDESLLVVPAWQGMRVLQLFFDVSADWHFGDQTLTHAAGIVFCHHKTPIAQAARAAEALTDSVKDGFDDRHPPGNAFDYLVLEAASYPTGTPAEFWRDCYGDRVKAQLPPLRPFSAGSTPWSERLPLLRERLSALPRGALYAIAGDWVTGWRSGNHQALQTRIARFIEVSGRHRYDDLFTYLFGYFNPEPPDPDPTRQQHNPGWLHLVELWDYLAPNTGSGAGLDAPQPPAKDTELTS